MEKQENVEEKRRYLKAEVLQFSWETTGTVWDQLQPGAALLTPEVPTPLVPFAFILQFPVLVDACFIFSTLWNLPLCFIWFSWHRRFDPRPWRCWISSLSLICIPNPALLITIWKLAILDFQTLPADDLPQLMRIFSLNLQHSQRHKFWLSPF